MSNPTNKLAEFAPQARQRVKYAPLTAGLLARKGEALPATPYFAAEALDLYSTGIAAATRPEASAGAIGEHAEPAHIRRPANMTFDELRPNSFTRTQAWRSRHLPVPHEPPSASAHLITEALEARHARESHESSHVRDAQEHIPSHDPHQHSSNEAPVSAQSVEAIRVTLSLEFDVEVLALLAQHSRRTLKAPARVIEELLKSHLGRE